MFDLYQKGQLDASYIHAVGSDKAEQGMTFVGEMIDAKAKCLDNTVSKETCDSLKVRFAQDCFSYSQLTRTKDPTELAAHYIQLNSNIEAKLHTAHETRIFYLSVPDSAHVSTVKMVKQQAMPAPGSTVRFVIEKPFGASLADCQQRQASLEEQGLRTEEIWRLDHYLGKRGVRNILDFRLNNPKWEQHWNAEHVASIEVVVQENEDVADRIDFYSETGVVRDMMVNHMMEVLATVAMELPGDAQDLAQVPLARAALLESITPLVQDDLILGQYEEYDAHFEEHYERNPTARQNPRGEHAPTLGYAKLSIPNQRWNGVHFGIVHAKGVAERKAYVRIQFKSGEVLLFHIQGSTGDEFISASAPAPPMKMEGWNSFVRKSGDSEEQVLVPSTKSLQAYEVLLGDAMKGDQSYFVTFREVVAGYKAWDAVMEFVPISAKYKLGTPLHTAVQSAAETSPLCAGTACATPVLSTNNWE